jgi:indolepyruvate ferredoxin oxidoreductase, beta subunit
MTTAVQEFNIIMAGIGGQGVILMSEVIGAAAVRDGLKVRGSEVLGMAQRGGSVFSNIRLGSEVEAPMTADSKCDILVALEPSEGLRNIQYLNSHSSVVLNIRKVIPTTVSLGKSTYPEIEEIKKRLLAVTPDVITVDAVELAEKAGNRQATNVVMLGTLFGSGKMPISLERIKEVIKEKVPAKALEANIKAFDLGYQASHK